MASAQRVSGKDRGEGPGASHTRYWYAGRAAAALIPLAVAGLLWILHRQNVEEHRTGLIRDVLWIEQNFQAALERDAESLRHVGLEIGGADPVERERALGELLPGSAGLVGVAVLESGDAPAASDHSAVPPDAARRAVASAADPAYALARSTGRPAYGVPRDAGTDHRFEVFVPLHGGAGPRTIVGVYDMRALLGGVVPWWLAQRHRVTVRNAAGEVLATKSHVEAAGGPELTYQVPLDPPGHGLLLHVESYDAEGKLVRNLLAVTICALAGAVMWSLWSLRRHVQRRLETERALRDEHAFRKAMEDSLETGMRAVDLEGRIVYVNPAFCRMVGFSAEELVGHPAPQPYWPPEDRDRIEKAQRDARAAGKARIGFELELLRRGGERFDALLYETPLVDARGRQTGWMASILDITERKRARERARQQQEKLAATARLVSVGEMASAIAHELNQPLSAIASYSAASLNMLGSPQVAPAEIRDALTKTAQQAERAGRIIRRIHDFVRKSEPARSKVRVAAVLEEALGFAAAEARKRRVRLTARLAARDAELDADPLLLEQVVLNLVRNGMDAMAATPEEAREIVVSQAQVDGVVTVSVADRGCGLAPDVARHLFEPFFTTKREGMGMGLNICRSIVEAHGGRLWADAGTDGGAVFSFSLPLEAR